MTPLMFLLPLISCVKSDAVKPELEGKWYLLKVDLFEDNKHSASDSTRETTYQFCCEDKTNQLIINEDNESRTFLYTYDAVSNSIWLNSKKMFRIEELSLSRLILTDSYETYKSVYTFAREG